MKGKIYWEHTWALPFKNQLLSQVQTAALTFVTTSNQFFINWRCCLNYTPRMWTSSADVSGRAMPFQAPNCRPEDSQLILALMTTLYCSSTFCITSMFLWHNPKMDKFLIYDETLAPPGIIIPHRARLHCLSLWTSKARLQPWQTDSDCAKPLNHFLLTCITALGEAN